MTVLLDWMRAYGIYFFRLEDLYATSLPSMILILPFLRQAG